ncbi:hypothetical protein GW17_00007388 [Ensete ventricosum]|nr:hypothetical protein GW17_00007388 [Ensete ventricosum]RZR94823.1 hypothetical protein BHM03_00023579 [Ensete ventricosum]
MLIMDDEEELPVECPTLPVQRLPCTPQIMMLPSSYGYEMAFRRERKGTGVFIPLSTAPTSKNRRPTRRSSTSVRNSATVASPIHPNHCSNSGVLTRHIYRV